MVNKIPKGFVHKLPADMKKVLMDNPSVLKKWESLTPLARNEFICWVENAKKEETRKLRIRRTSNELKEGKRRPCCWAGCPHHNPRNKKWFRNGK